MSDRERVILLERELIETRNAATGLVVGWLAHRSARPADYKTAAEWFDQQTIDTDNSTARLARLIAETVRRL